MKGLIEQPPHWRGVWLRGDICTQRNTRTRKTDWRVKSQHLHITDKVCTIDTNFVSRTISLLINY